MVFSVFPLRLSSAEFNTCVCVYAIYIYIYIISSSVPAGWSLYLMLYTHTHVRTHAHILRCKYVFMIMQCVCARVCRCDYLERLFSEEFFIYPPRARLRKGRAVEQGARGLAKWDFYRAPRPKRIWSRTGGFKT